MRGYVLLGCTLSLFACGGETKKKSVKKPKTETVVEAPKEETEEDRAKARKDKALAIVPEGSNCLPAAIKEEGGPRLELAAAGADAILCAVDTQEDRLLGPVGCWKIDLASGGLSYMAPELMPGRGTPVLLEKGCAWGYCLPKDAKTTGSAFIAKDIDGGKVAVLAGDDVHIFDSETKAHESRFSIRGEKGVTNDPIAMHLVGGHVVVEGADQGAYSAVWVFKSDGTQIGPVVALGSKDGKPLSTYKGSVSVLDNKRIGVAHRGIETLTTFDLASGARAKIVRRMKQKPTCKAAELDAYWHGEDKVSDKCKASIEKLYGPLIGASGVAGRTSYLMVLRGNRVGELAALDQKTLEEKKSFKLQWCAADGADGADAAEEPAKQ